MALSDTKLKNLKPADKAYQEADDGGLFVEVQPGGTKTFRLRYRIGGRGAKQEKITLGDYPTFALAEARTWRDHCKVLAGRGFSPAALKRGDAIPQDAAPALKELAQAFIRDWCLKTRLAPMLNTQLQGARKANPAPATPALGGTGKESAPGAAAGRHLARLLALMCPRRKGTEHPSQ